MSHAPGGSVSVCVGLDPSGEREPHFNCSGWNGIDFQTHCLGRDVPFCKARFSLFSAPRNARIDCASRPFSFVMRVTLKDKVRGCLIAGAIGDAMGGAFEGHRGPLRYREHDDWRISDDTQLTLATCESIIELGNVNPEHVAERFLQWYKQRRLSGVGSSTLKALRDLDAGAHWALAGAKGEMSAGNGAAMRIAPLAFHLDPGSAEQRQLIRDVCRITHHNEEAHVGALAVVAAIRWLTFDETASPTQLFEAVLNYLPDSRVRDRIVELKSLPNDLSVEEVGKQYGTSGYVVESVPLALYAARNIDRFPLKLVLRDAIEAGGDTDTIASITGQIAGAWIGASQIPAELIESLPNIENVIDRFAETIT